MGNKLDSLLVKPCHPHHQDQLKSHSEQPLYCQQQQHHSSSSYQQQHSREHLQDHHRHSHQQQYNHQSYESEKQKQKSSIMGSFRRKKGKLSSCPDLLKEAGPSYYNSMGAFSSGLREYKSSSPEKDIDIKIYRSYTDLPAQGDSQPPLKIKVYRKSQESLTNIGRVHSMPKGMNKTESSEFSVSIESRLSVATQEFNRPLSRKSSRCSNASSTTVNCRASINIDDFPNLETVKKKLSTFEQFFSNLVVKYFKNMSLIDQLSCICVAIMPDRANQSVSLLHYLQSSDIPNDLGRSEIVQQPHGDSDMPCLLSYYPTLPDFLLDEIHDAKLNTPAENQATVCHDLAVKIVTFLAKEAAIELGRIYEYQLSLIQETIAFRLLAKYAATNVFEAVKNRGKLLDRNTVVSAAMMQYAGKRSSTSSGAGSADYSGSSASPKWISVISFTKELKWNIYDLFRKAALRKDIYISDSADIQKYSEYSPSLSPSSLKKPGHNLSPPPMSSTSFVERRTCEPEDSAWKFYACSDSDPMVYGYRCQPVEWDFVRRRFRLSANDESRFVEELPWRYDDVHRLYCPYYRLLCDLNLLSYCDWLKSFEVTRPSRSYGDSAASSRSGSDSLRPTIRGFTEYVRQFKSGIHVRDEIRIIYRSVAGFDQIVYNNSKRSDVLVLRNSLLRNNESDSIASSQCATEVSSTPELSHRSVLIRGTPNVTAILKDGGQKDVESLRKALAQVTMECDQLCYNLKDMEADT